MKCIYTTRKVGVGTQNGPRALTHVVYTRAELGPVALNFDPESYVGSLILYQDSVETLVLADR